VTEVHFSRSEAETADLGRRLASRLQPGSVVLLAGPLGAGKTAMVRGLAAGLGCDAGRVSSPTFTIVQEYRGPMVLQHVDLYRLDATEAEDLGLEELQGDSVVAVEWPDRWPGAPPEAISVTFEVAADGTRRIAIDE
jgi:tRNA threonylcarbamoyladenosine biosynthesis protein TsaE